MNTAYWGPPIHGGIPQPALSVNLGPVTNVNSISFSNNALAPVTVSGQVQDRQTNTTVPVMTFVSTRPPLSSEPAILSTSRSRKVLFQGSGLTITEAYARAQAQTDASTDNVVTASGELNAVRYGGILQSRGVVGFAGWATTMMGSTMSKA